MALQPNPDGTYNVIDDVTGAITGEGIPPDLLGSLIPTNPEPPPVPDTRLAEVSAQTLSPTGQRSPIKPPGAESVADLFNPVKITAGAPSAPAPPTSSSPSGPPPSSAALPPLPASGMEQSPTADALRGEALRLMQPRPGVSVDRPAKNVLRNFQVDVAPKLSPGTKEEVDLARDLHFTRAGRLAAEGGMLASAAHEDAAMQYERRRTEAQLELARIRDEERERDALLKPRMRELDMLGEELRAKKGVDASDYWEDKGAFGTVMAHIGMFLYSVSAGLREQDPLGLAKMIDKDIDRYIESKNVEAELLGKEITHKEKQLDQVRSRFISRDAANAATRALMLESAAAEASTLAESYKSAEAQNGALQLINTLQMQAAEARAAAELAEKDAIRQAWEHREALRGAVGGSRGKSITEVANLLFPGDPERVIKATRLIQEGKLPIPNVELDVYKATRDKSVGSATMEKFHQQGLVQLPDGRVAFVPRMDQARDVEAALHALPELRNNLKRLKKIVSGVSTIDKLSPDDRAFLNALPAANAKLLKGSLGEALTSGENKELWSKLTGGDIKDLWRLANEEKQLDVAIGVTQQFEREEMGKLRKPPAGVDVGTPFEPPVITEPDL